MKADDVIDLIQTDDSITFIEDLCVELSISRTAFYRYFPAKSQDYKKIREVIDINKYKKKKKIRKIWEIDPKNQNGLVCLYKLYGTNEDREKLSMQHIKHEGGTNDHITVVADTKADAEEIQNMLKELEEKNESDTDI